MAIVKKKIRKYQNAPAPVKKTKSMVFRESDYTPEQLRNMNKTYTDSSWRAKERRTPNVSEKDARTLLKYKIGGKIKKAKTGAWQRKEGKSPSGGLNAKGRASLKAEGHNIKPPQPGGGPRKRSFCARMSGMKKKLTSSKTANDPNSRINKSLRKWKC